jgi:hypothetical protein
MPNTDDWELGLLEIAAKMTDSLVGDDASEEVGGTRLAKARKPSLAAGL